MAEFKRIFSRKGLPSDTSGARLSVAAWEAIDALAERIGLKRSDIIGEAIDQYLQTKAEKGEIKIPEDLLQHLTDIKPKPRKK